METAKNRIKVPSSREVGEDRDRLEGEKRDLFSVVSSGGVVCDDEVVEVVEEGGVGNERRKRQRPDSRKGIGKGEFKSGYLAPPVEPPSSSGVENEFPNTVGNRISLVAAQAQAKTGLVINRKQVGNPMLRYFRNVVYHFSDSIAPDFLRYHLLHPEYIYGRVRKIGSLFKTRVLLILIDIQDHEIPLRELTKMSVVYEWVIIAVSSNKEAARYLESYRIYEHKSAESIMQRVEEDYFSKLQGALSSIRMVNKTDVRSLSLNFGTLKNVVSAPKQELMKCPGIGGQKVGRLYDVFNTPFKKDPKKAQPSPH